MLANAFSLKGAFTWSTVASGSTPKRVENLCLKEEEVFFSQGCVDLPWRPQTSTDGSKTEISTRANANVKC